MSSVLDLGGAVIMSKAEAVALVRAIEGLPREDWEGTSSFFTRLYEHFKKHDALDVLMGLKRVVKPKENLEL